VGFESFDQLKTMVVRTQRTALGQRWMRCVQKRLLGRALSAVADPIIAQGSSAISIAGDVEEARDMQNLRVGARIAWLV
jgi:hypothetical protein